MPLLRYFLFVGGVLLALLFISDAYLPKLPAAERADADLPVIRIQSDRKWPERVVFDTSRPASNPAPIAASVPAPAAIADDSAKVRVREAFAQLQQPDARQLRTSDAKPPDPKPQPKRKVVSRRAAPPVMLMAQQPQSGFFANSTW
jgi:hypothetical protein